MASRGRPAKPMLGAAAGSDVEAAYDDLEGGAVSYEEAERFTSLCRHELIKAVDAGEIETFTHGRRVLLVKRSVRMWLARKLAAARAERARRELAGG